MTKYKYGSFRTFSEAVTFLDCNTLDTKIEVKESGIVYDSHSNMFHAWIRVQW